MGAGVSIIPRDTPDGPKPPFPMKVLDRWDQFLGSIRAGVHLKDAMAQHYLTRADIEACCLDPDRRASWLESRAVAHRKGWDLFQFEEIFSEIAGGSTVVKALEKVYPAGDYSKFLMIIANDPLLKDQYDQALKASAISQADVLRELADDKTGDVLHQEKGPVGNTANVNRSKLQVETRLRLMASWNKRMFGEDRAAAQVQVNVNYAAELEEARERAKTRRATEISRSELEKAVEASFTEVPASPAPASSSEDWRDVSWMDEA